MMTLLFLCAFSASASASDAPPPPAPSWEDILASGDTERLNALVLDLAAPAEVRLQAALVALRRAGVGIETPPPIVEIPSNHPDFGCDADGQLVRRVPVVGNATLVGLTVEVVGWGEQVLVRGKLEGVAGRPLHYLVEGGSDSRTSRYVVSMLGVRSGLDAPVIPVNPLVHGVRVLERDGALILVIESAQAHGLRVDFEQDEDSFVVALGTARSS